MLRTKTIYFLISLFFSTLGMVKNSYGQSTCDPTTPSFIVNLSGKPDSAWFSPNVRRKGLCCGLDPNANPPIRCVEFLLTLDNDAQGIRFDIASGAVPPGALGYQIGCGPYNKIGENICLDGPGPHRLTFCEPGNNPNVYTIVSIPKPKVTPPITVSDACSATLTATGFQLSTIKWTSVPYNAVYNSYLNCTSACSTVVATYQLGAPPYVDYEVSGVPAGGCNSTLVTKTTRVYFVNDKKAQILPQDPTICFGGTTATLTANGSGGAPPYKYLWNTGETTQSINVGVGTYWVEITDATSCPSAKDTVIVTAFKSPITANAGPDLISCANNPAVTITGSVMAAKGGIWSGGNGIFNPSNTSLTITYTPTPAEIITGLVQLTLTTTGNGSCPSNSDVMQLKIVPSPIVNAGPDLTVCANNNKVNLNATVTNAAGGTWTGGLGTFTPDRNTLNASYIPTASEISSGSLTLTLTSTGNGTCLPVTDKIKITITPAPTVNAGIDKTVCANNASLNLSGTVTVASGGTWTGGTGAFTPNRNVLNPTYNPSSTEKSAGSVLLTLTTSGNGNCLPVSDNILITISPSPTVNAGLDRTVCANNTSLQLNGSVTVATGGVWSGGSGSYSPNVSTLNASYTPSAAEISVGKVTLTLTSTGNGLCLPVIDQMIITITPAPTANAGPDKTVCANNSSLVLNGTVTNATGGTWTGGTGTLSPNRNSLNVQYAPSASEITNGTVNLTLTTTGIGNCLPVSDIVMITITPSPIVNAGPDVTSCASASSVSLNGIVTTATGGTWKNSGTGSFTPNANTLTASYVPSAADKAAGKVTLTLTTTGNGNCLPLSDDLILTLAPPPTVIASPSQTVCADVNTISLSGAVTNSTGGIWSTNGSGTFTPNTTTLNTTYNLSAADKASGSVKLTLTTTGNAPCSPISTTTILTITPAPTVNAGPDKTVCSDISSVAISGSVTVATGGIWTTSGTGSFTPSASSLNAQYIPSSADKSLGNVTLTLRSTGNGGCIPVMDNMKIFFTPAPTINAGPDKQLCSDNPTAAITGSTTVATGGTWTGGNGIVSPNRNSLSISYTPSPLEITAGSVTLTLTSTGNGTCIPVKDDVKISYYSAPTVNAGPDQNLCGDVSSVQLNGLASNTTSINWTTTGTGTFTPNANSLNAKYNPSPSDLAGLSVTLTLNVVGGAGCNPKSDALVLNFTLVPTIDAGPDQTVCTNQLPIKLSAIGSPGKWTGGTGTYSPDDITLNTFYTPTASELATGSITLTITTNATSTCAPVSDDVLISFIKGPIVNAGPDITVCADTAAIPLLNGSITNSPGAKWSTSGSGTFLPNEFTLNANYVPSTADTIAGSITLTLSTTGSSICDPVSDDLTLIITPAPTVNAGFDKIICADVTSINLSGAVSVATGGTWKASGTGAFNPDNQSLNTTYQITPADTAAHSVTLTLTTTGNGMCKPVSDIVVISINPIPVVKAGKDTSVCKDVNLITLNGLVVNATGGIWSTTGTGTFTPGPGNTGVDYILSLADKATGSVKLTLRSTGNGTCNAVSNSIILSFTPTPTISAGADQTICADSNWISLTGSVTVSTGGKWSSSGTGSFTNQTGLTTRYNLSSADSAAGNVVITFTSTGNGTCNPVADNMVLTITPAPTINAGPDLTICADATNIALFGTVTTSTSGTWTTSGSGSFIPSANQLNTIYQPSSADTTAGSVVLTITSNGNGQCKAVYDNMVLSITPAPIAIAITPGQVCKDATKAAIQGLVYHATGGAWTSLGSGTFSPNSTTLTTDYIPSSTDKSNGTVQLVLSTTGNGTCFPASDTITLVMNPGPIVFAGSDQVICADADSILLAGDILLAGGAKWTTSGSGVFAPNDSTLNAYYKPSPSDTTAGNVTLTLTSIHNGGCNAVTDDINLTISPAPTINAGSDQLVCSNTTSISLNGTTTVATGGNWSTDGTGSISSSNQLSTTYSPSLADTSKVLTFVITSTGNGTCKPVNDTLKISFSPIPTIATEEATICIDNIGANLGVTFTNATGVKWVSSGTGIFSPSNTDTNPLYIPSSLDFTISPISITVSTNGSGACPPASASIKATIKPAPIVSAGPDKTVCKDNPIVSLTGNVQFVGGGIWSTSGTGTFSPDPTQMNVTYVPSTDDITLGTLPLVLTTTGNGDCIPRQDTVLITITPAPTVNAGSDLPVCPAEINIDLNGTVTVASGGTWTILNGTGTIVSPSSLSTKYNFTAADKTSGVVRFILTTTGNGLCNAVKDTVSYNFRPLPTVTVSDDQVVCSNEEAVAFFGIITVASGATWHSTGTGIFSNSTSLLTRYYPSTEDKEAGQVKLYLTTDLGTTCKQVTDTVNLDLTPIPIANAGLDKIVCIDSNFINLNGSVVGATGGNWTSSGSGTFAPDPNNLKATYTFSATDKSSGYVRIILSTTGNPGCYNTDTINVNIYPIPDIQLQNIPACIGDKIILSAVPINLGNLPQAIYSWTKDNVPLKDSIPSINVKEPGLYIVKYSLGSCRRSDSSLVAFNPLPVTDMDDKAVFCKETKPVTISAGPGHHYLWLSTGSTKRDTTVNDEGWYYVKVYNQFNCASLDSVNVVDICPPRVFVPTIFSPNNDGHNEFMTTFGKYFTNYKLTVFSRWGEIIFYSEDPKKYWDGNYLGQPMPNGVYAWVLYYEGLSESYKGPYKQEGSITIDR